MSLIGVNLVNRYIIFSYFPNDIYLDEVCVNVIREGIVSEGFQHHSVGIIWNRSGLM